MIAYLQATRRRTKALLEKSHKGASATDNESVDLSINSLFPQGGETSKDSEKSEKTVESDILRSIAAEYDLDEACSNDVDPKLAKIINKMKIRT